MQKKQALILSILGVLSIVLITVGVTYAFFNYAKEGTTENSVTSGTITFLYTEISGAGKGIKIRDAYPMSDEMGKVQVGEGKVFDFKITSNTPSSIGIPYEVTARKKDNSTLEENAVKLYLTKTDGKTEEEVLLEKYSNLDQTKQLEESKYIEKTIYKGKVPANSESYEQNFRLRMWIDENTDFSPVIGENGENIYPYNNETFTVIVNVYANGKVLTESDIELEKDIRVEKVLVGGEELTKIENADYQYETYFSEDTTNTDIKVTTKNPLASVKISSLQENDRGNYTLVSGENIFEVTIISEDKNSTDSFKIKVTVLKIGDNWSFDYSGNEVTYKIPVTGMYKLETWGAQGGSYTEIYHGGYGGYSSGTIFLNRNNNLYVNVGGAGTFGNGSSNGGYNGGGSAIGAKDVANGSGGGATHIAKVSGLLSTLSNNVDDILIVSGGGGGGCHWYNNSQTNYSYGRGGSGGGTIGGTGYTTYKLNSSSFGGNGIGGSQIAGGTGGTAKVSWGRGNSGSFGLGGGILDVAASGGGGGYYGGGSGYDVGAGGGSGYIGNELLTDKVMYCYSCTISDEESTKTESTTNVSDSPISEYVKMGNGYARITYLKKI